MLLNTEAWLLHCNSLSACITSVRSVALLFFRSQYTCPELGCEAVNLGTGKGVSVLELVAGMGKATGKPVPNKISPRRPGDVASMYADPTLALDLLKWKAELGVEEMCRDTWKWQSTNPFGYEKQAEEELVLETKN